MAAPTPPPAVRLAVYLGGAALMLAVWSPVWPGTPDSFPLSSYPMFSRRRPDFAWMATAKGRTRAGLEVTIPTRFLARGEPMQAVATLRRALAGGRDAARALCHQIAARAEGSDLVSVELRYEKFAIMDYFRGSPEPLDVRTAARCRVESEF
ncbi:MAG: hypothetical protein ACFB9M_14870 [Myxococcota bacterium]